jgi:phage FluMu gp28-like protein
MPESLVKLYPYEQRWLVDDSRFKIGMFSRQTGKTFTTALEVVEDCVESEARGQRARWLWLSRGQRQAQEAMEEDIKPHCRLYGAAFKALEYDYGKDEDGIVYKALEVTFPKHGSRITALPANPDTARGYSANVVLDEFARHQNSRAIWAGLFPSVRKSGLKLRVISTPNGKGNMFYELMTGNDKIWSRHSVNIYQAVADGLECNIDELRAASHDEDLWAQEFELKWLDEAEAWLPFELIMACESPEAGNPGMYGGGICYVGNDIAVRRDLWVAWVLELVGDVLWTREVRVLKRKLFAEQDAAIDEIMKKYRVARLFMDQTGMGEKPVEDAIRRYGASRVEGMLFTPANKLNIATAGKTRFEDRKIRIPEGDMELRADLHKPKRVLGPTGAVRFVADDDEAGHADRFWAAMLACQAAEIAPREYAYMPAVPPPSGRFDDTCTERDAYNDALSAGGAGGWRARMARFGKGTW